MVSIKTWASHVQGGPYSILPNTTLLHQNHLPNSPLPVSRLQHCSLPASPFPHEPDRHPPTLLSRHLPEVFTMVASRKPLSMPVLFIGGLEDSPEHCLRYGTASCVMSADGLSTWVFEEVPRFPWLPNTLPQPPRPPTPAGNPRPGPLAPPPNVPSPPNTP